MLREEYFRRLIEGAHIELYLSANDGARVFWPWRMQPPHEASSPYRNACERYVIDSAPQKPETTTQDVLDCAYRLDAEVASLNDVYLDKDATVDSLLKGLEVADDHAFDGQLLLPLQEPYDQCWKELGEPTEQWLGLGGLKDAPPDKRMQEVKAFRNAVGDDVWVHGFGWGVKGICSDIRQNPELIDSLDYSTPMQNNIGSNLTKGEERTSVEAAYSGAKLIRDLREVSEYPNQSPEETRSEGQHGLGGFS